MNVKRKHALGLISGIAGLTLTPRLARAQSAQTIRMVIVSGETSATAYYAKELGMFAKAGIEPEITEVTNGPAAAAAVAGGSMDIGSGEPTSLIIAHDRGLPFSILAPAALARAGNQSNGFVIAGKTNGVKSGADLTGKIVGLNALGGLPYLSVRAWIDKTGGDSGAVHFLEIPFSQMIDAIKNGRIEASEINAAFDPLIGKPDDPVRLIASSYDYVAPRFTSSVWFGTSDWIAKNPDLAKRFLSAMRQAAVWANAHPHESAEMLAPHLKQTVAQIEATPRVSYGLDMLPEFIQPVIDLAAKYGSIKTRFAARDLINAVALK
jgi:NitT/TauT family transport system substrate-binding protein